MIAENLVPSYKQGDREALKETARILLPALKEKTAAVHKAHKKMWFASNKVLGWSNLDIRYAGMVARCDTAIDLIEAYLSGELENLEELDQERLYKPLSGFAHYSAMATPNIDI